MGQTGKLGCICKGAVADLLVVDGNPLENISLLAGEHASIAMIVKDGKFHKLAR
jgi:imidazolonepropionase-like amidohydrolase